MHTILLHSALYFYKCQQIQCKCTTNQAGQGSSLLTWPTDWAVQYCILMSYSHVSYIYIWHRCIDILEQILNCKYSSFFYWPCWCNYIYIYSFSVPKAPQDGHGQAYRTGASRMDRQFGGLGGAGSSGGHGRWSQATTAHLPPPPPPQKKKTWGSWGDIRCPPELNIGTGQPKGTGSPPWARLLVMTWSQGPSQDLSATTFISTPQTSLRGYDWQDKMGRI